jgi:hypothetical protein
MFLLDSATGRLIEKWGWLLPAATLGLYAGRLVSEFLRPGIVGALAITLVAVLSACLLLRRRPVRQTVPALILLVYVVYPEPDPVVAIAVGILALLTALFNARSVSVEGALGDWKVQAALLIGLALVLLVMYVGTLAPDILPADNGEFQLVAEELGVAHPTGFPLYSMLANLMTKLPIAATPAYKVNLFSAITSTATLLLVYLSVRRLTASILASIVAAMALSTATTFWAQATTANIRSMTAMFAAMVIYLLLVLRDSRKRQLRDSIRPDEPGRNDELTSPSRSVALIILLVVALSLGITHHASLAFMSIVFVAVLISLFPRLLRSPRLWPGLILAGAVGLVPLLYLPLRGAAGALGAPADLTTLEGFLRHVLALGFRGDFLYFLEPSLFLERVKVMANVLTFQFSPVLLIFAGAGLVLLFFNDRLVAFMLGGAFLVHTVISALYRAPQTVEYMLPAYVPLAICLGYAVGILRSQVTSSANTASWLRQFVASMLVALVCVAVLFQFLDRLPSFRLLSDSTDARDYAQPLLEQVPPGTTILADWHWATPLWYLQAVEGHGPDVDVAYVFPTGEPYGDTWARRISELLDEGQPVIATHYDEAAYAQLPPPEPYQDAFFFRTSPRETLPEGFESRSVNLQDTVEIVGFALESPLIEVGQEAIVTVAWRPQAEGVDSVRMFAHLVDGENGLVAQDDVQVKAQPEGITLTQFRLTPQPDTTPGDYAILIGEHSLDSPADLSGLTRVPIAELAVAASAWPLPTNNPASRTLAQEGEAQRLIGYDWDHTLPGRTRLYLHWKTAGAFRTEVQDLAGDSYELPAWYGPWGLIRESTTLESREPSYYVPFGKGIVWTGRPFSAGTDLPLEQNVEATQCFLSSRPITRDLVVSIRLVGFEEDGFHWAWWDLDDGVPAMGAIPTLKWIQGSRVRDPRWLTIADGAWIGQATAPLLRLYDAFTGRALPILDERISKETSWVQLGATTIGE